MAAETPKPLELFYIYAHADKPQLKRLQKHLTLLQRNGLIRTWHDLELLPGSLWQEETAAHLEMAQIILLLVSPDFMDSDYCYRMAMQRALQRHTEGTAHVIPVILKPVYWEDAPFAKLSPLPRDAKPITGWSDRDAAFADVVLGIRRVVNILNDLDPEAVLYTENKHRTKGKSMEEEVIVSTPGALTPLILKKAADRYQKDLKVYDGKASYELALRPAFHNLLADMARRVNWT
ncbi:MAG: toll/interleukin-1 receptor domain-containing protein, partial [Ktedonobacteraceae bacterium]